jgi:hypothetical protein
MKYVFSMMLALALLAPACALAYRDYGDKIDVMTQNQYLGADLTPIIAATDAGAFNQALINALQQIAANHYPARARKLAQLIARRLPELVGLQEVFALGCFDLNPLEEPGCNDPGIDGAFNDHLTLTLEALGQSYVAVAIVNNLDLTDNLGIPGFPVAGLPVDLDFDGTPDIAVTILDRDVILARGDIAAVPVDFGCTKLSEDGCNYEIVASVEAPLGEEIEIEIAIERGWLGVDATIRGKDYRFVNTHLEVQEPEEGNTLSGFFQAAQAAELIAFLDTTTPWGSSLIVVGDINSSPEDPIIPGPLPLPKPFDAGIVPPYMQLVDSGYTDAWTELPIPRPGFTCCQDADLSNKRSFLDARIDVIFSADVPDKVRRGRVLGATIFEKVWSTWPNPLWPSDHGSVAAELGFK